MTIYYYDEYAEETCLEDVELVNFYNGRVLCYLNHYTEDGKHEITIQTNCLIAIE